jgi:hypothetical protein
VRTRIVGGSARERTAIRRVVARLGRSNRVVEVRLAPSRMARRGSRALVVRIPPRLAGSALAEAEWQALLVAGDVLRALPRRSGIRELEVVWPEGGFGFPVRSLPRTPAATVAEARAAAASIRARAVRAGYQAPAVRVLLLDRLSVRVALRLREDQLFDRRARAWWSALAVPPPHRPRAVLLQVEAPDGTPIFVGQSEPTFARGGKNFGADAVSMPVPTSPPPATLTGPTRLEIELTPGTDSPRLRPLRGRPPQEPRPVRYVLDCTSAPPTGVRDAGAACRRVLADRWALFVPRAAESWCSSGGGYVSPMVRVRGTLGGVAVDDEWGGCYAGTALRWQRFLASVNRGAG